MLICSRAVRLLPFAALGLLILMAGATDVLAQPAGPVRRVGFFWIGTPDGNPSPSLAPFLEGMRERGYAEGRNLVIDARDGRGDAARMGAEAAALAASGVEVIVTQGSSPTAVAKQATSRVPIVFGAAGDPVGRGLVASLARPGGNVTGRAIDLGWSTADEIVREAAPAVRRVGLLYYSQGLPPGYHPIFLAERQAAAVALGFELTPLPIGSVDDVEPALAGFAKDGGEALFVNGDPTLMTGRGVVLPLALRYRLASVCTDLRFPQAGCLLTYGDDVSDSFRQAAGIVDRILKGAKPADLPIEQPTKFTLIVNAKTANALGITIPSSILARADEVIE
ncbi:MAG: ABC transporter substrate-binding protein [Reyranella sp.]|nr:ABC transporter substrate-binding protein [Reyranella sp.]